MSLKGYISMYLFEIHLFWYTEGLGSAHIANTQMFSLDQIINDIGQLYYN